MGSLGGRIFLPLSGFVMNLRLGFDRLSLTFIDFLFPIFCAGCKKEGAHLCDSCFDAIPRQEECRDSIFSAARFEEHSLLAKLIHRFKYEFASDIGKILAELAPEKCPFEAKILCPVPLHWWRKNFRGFNQSEILAIELSRKWNIPWENLLKRRLYTQPQIELARKKRLINVIGAFAQKIPHGFDEGVSILLIDDVCTTGATLRECIKTLSNAGAKSIYGFVIARAL